MWGGRGIRFLESGGPAPSRARDAQSEPGENHPANRIIPVPEKRAPVTVLQARARFLCYDSWCTRRITEHVPAGPAPSPASGCPSLLIHSDVRQVVRMLRVFRPETEEERSSSTWRRTCGAPGCTIPGRRAQPCRHKKFGKGSKYRYRNFSTDYLSPGIFSGQKMTGLFTKMIILHMLQQGRVR